MSSIESETRPTYAGSDDATEVLTWGLKQYSPKIALACSFSVEDIAVIHLMKQVRDDVRVFALDTGRLNEETYECADRVSRELGVKLEWYFPKAADVERLETEKGLFSFRDSLNNRKECCGIRKVEPLNRALSTLDAWITGMRREQSVTRGELGVVEMDDAHGGIAKLNPIAAWSEQDTWAYIREHNLPYNKLHDMGYPSIGCAPCTRAIRTGEDTRSGRWWWENPDHKECGLHVNVRPETIQGGNI